ncbi:hypothetical protein BT63DRAFT_443311 [Microthyrium microscopicum]|uniref:Zn(2)-C6 fungal-type domain-containing protein n=1 Tax=Microthyrium microscopicum TaxID=703497 RepID=A0A6A6U231_9PEZI|nr:hypothetical protein BT63DRAFT_443311 [Microthyrium microscopicum]
MQSVNGQRSKGCAKCRSRKIKCDLVRPVCSRCTKIGNQDCVYQDQFEIILRDETSRAGERARTKWRSRAKQPNPTEPSLSPEMDIPEEKISERFLYDWVLVKTGPTATYGHFFLDYLPDMLERSPKNSILRTAIDALSYVNYAQRCNAPELLPYSFEKCTRALKMLKAMMEKPDEACSDETLTAITLLGLYEAMSSANITANSSWAAHVNGSMILLHLRVLRESQPAIWQSLSAMIYKQMIIHSITRGAPPGLPLSMHTLFTSGRAIIIEQWELLHKTAELCGSWNTLLGTTPDKGQIWEHIKQGMALDQGLEQWATRLTPEWNITRLPLDRNSIPSWLWPLFEEGHWAPKFLQQNQSLIQETKWRDWLMARLVLNEAVLQSIDLLKESTDINSSEAWSFELEQINRNAVENRLISVIDSTLESCIWTLIRQMSDRPEASTIEQVCTVRGFMTMSGFSGSFLCLKQVSFERTDVTGRTEWCLKALQFLENYLGFRKAGAFALAEEVLHTKSAVQFWALVHKDPSWSSDDLIHHQSENEVNLEGLKLNS